jgi:hypothetical protein
MMWLRKQNTAHGISMMGATTANIKLITERRMVMELFLSIIAE